MRGACGGSIMIGGPIKMPIVMAAFSLEGW